MSSLGLLETENEEKIKKKANKYVSFDQFKTKFAHLGVSQIFFLKMETLPRAPGQFRLFFGFGLIKYT